jgi:hypothetical protein
MAWILAQAALSLGERVASRRSDRARAANRPLKLP